jgi:adenylosuccinate synthase
MQSLPVGWTNPKAKLVLGRGGLIDFHQLKKEVDSILVHDPYIKERIYIDARAGVLDERHHKQEGGVDGELHRRIGSTGEGVGAARVARINRDPSRFSLAADAAKEWGFAGCVVEDASDLIRKAVEDGDDTLLEGTQGSGLSLIHGPWPFVTSADTNAGQFAADLGIAPRFIDRTLLVVRSHPIRVAGNSGPLKNEMTWSQMSAALGKTVEEKTTVTLKTRRVGEWDEDLFTAALKLNAPTSLALTFTDYIDPAVEGITMYSALSSKVKGFIAYLERLSGVPVLFAGTGGHHWQVVRMHTDLVP